MSAREGKKTLEERIARQKRENAPRPRPSESSQARQKPEDHERLSALERDNDELRRPSRLVFDPGGRSPPLPLRCSRGPQLSTSAAQWHSRRVPSRVGKSRRDCHRVQTVAGAMQDDAGQGVLGRTTVTDKRERESPTRTAASIRHL